MQFRKLKHVIIILFFALLVGGGTPAQATAPREVEIEARLVEFDPESGIYRASGGVVLTSGDLQLEAETVFYNQKTEVITAEQGVILQTATGEWEGEKLVYSFRTEEGTLTAFHGAIGTSFYTGQTGQLRSDEILVQDGSFTRCELVAPCVSIRAGRVRLVDDRVQVRGGWLYLKELPVLPLPPVTFTPDHFENWPQLEIGINKPRGFYVLGRLTHQVDEEVTLHYGAGAGTNHWWNGQAGIRWQPSSDLVFDSGLTWEEYLRGNASLTYNWAPVRFRTAFEHNWAERPTGGHSFSVRGPVTEKSSLELSYTSRFAGKDGDADRRADYGLNLTGRWLPGFTLGAGLFYGEGALLDRDSMNGWHLRTTWTGGITLAPTWQLRVAGESRWQAGDAPLWVENEVKLVKDLHCFKVDLGYDLVDESINFNFGFNW